MASADLKVNVDIDASRVLALLHRIERMDDPAMQRAAFIAYEALGSVGQAFDVDTIGPRAGCMAVAVHPTPALRRIVDGLVEAARADR